jgi:putative ABC transport system permease protein
MLKNYLKIALAVLKRRKFFTFISLFGISFTLTIIIILTAFLDHFLSASYPDVNRSRELYIIDIKMTSPKGDLYKGQVSTYYFDQYISKLKPYGKIALTSEPKTQNAYVNNKKIKLQAKYTNDEFWQVFQYEFLEGKPFTSKEISSGQKVVVISEDTKKKYFGDAAQVAGKFIETDNIQYRVLGVVKNVALTLRYNYADIYLPYTEAKVNFSSREYTGIFFATILANNPDDIPRIQEEYQQIVSKVQLDKRRFEVIQSFADPYYKIFTRQSVALSDDSGDSGVVKIFTITGILFFLFLLLPTLNLVNINISRIFERASEIGIRKAFGASSRTLVIQFIVENLILTLIGGVIGVVLSFVIIIIFNNSNVIDNLQLSINFTVLFVSLIVCLIFGLLSGVYPAWRMSKLDVVTALKTN